MMKRGKTLGLVVMALALASSFAARAEESVVREAWETTRDGTVHAAKKTNAWIARAAKKTDRWMDNAVDEVKSSTKHHPAPTPRPGPR